MASEKQEYAKMLKCRSWWIIRRRESGWNHHLDFWEKIASAEDEADADRIVKALNAYGKPGAD